ncbi:acyl carrier protein [Streptomyces sp. NPDC091204]|uniref:acyl carrier protein n=1 Tax=Streptomyces sp. NPDC091204 TaxID=3155299 RepID=UPI00341E67E1
MTQNPEPSEIADWLAGHLATLLNVPSQDMDPQLPLDALGITSMEEVILTADLEQRYGISLPIPDMRRHPTIEGLSRYIHDRLPHPA